MKALPRKFYQRDPAEVAKNLLGKILVRKINSNFLAGKIVETEAYYGKEDPASRVHLGRPKYCVKLMYSTPGIALIFNVHANWLFNVVAHEKGKPGAVLIRAIQPLQGIEIMKKNRKLKEISNLANGPGKLTRALAITKELNGIDLTHKNSPVFIAKGKNEKFEVRASYRIGVTKDLKKKLRFFISNNF